MVEIKCECCEKIIYVKESSKRKYCSRECFTKSITNPTKIINCKYCFKEIEVSLNSKTKYCSKICSDDGLKKRKNIICKQCNKEYIVVEKSNSEFCSLICYKNFRNNNPNIKIQSNQIITLYDKTCVNCGKIYKVHNYRKDISKFCSNECHNDYRREIVICDTCKQEFIFPKYENRKYCSDDCASKGINKRKSNFSQSIESFLISNNYSYITEFKIHNEIRKVYTDFLVENNIIIECYGDYWHCNPNKFDTNYFHTQIQKTANQIWNDDKDRIEFIKDKYKNVIIIWEYDWNKDKKELFKNLKNKMEEIKWNIQK